MGHNQKTIVVGVDTGNYCMKTKHCTWVAGVHTSDTKPEFCSERIIWYKDTYYTLVNSRNTYLPDKTVDDTYFVMTLFAICDELKARNISDPCPRIALAVGLPPSHMRLLKDKFAQYFSRGIVQFEYDGEAKMLEIVSVDVYAQGLSAVYKHMNEIEKNPKSFIIDIGGYTTDIICFDNGSVNPNSCFTEEYGIIHLYNIIRKVVYEQYGMKIEHSHIERMFDEPKYDLGDANIRSLVESTAENYVNSLLRELSEKSIDLKINGGFFMGGGSVRLEKYIADSPFVRNPVLIKNIRANACGYEALTIWRLNKK